MLGRPFEFDVDILSLSADTTRVVCRCRSNP
jgi:hypothetical protein